LGKTIGNRVLVIDDLICRPDYLNGTMVPDSHLKKIELVRVSMVPISGKTPMDEYLECIDTAPLRDDVYDIYDTKEERLQEQNYQNELRFRSMKRSL
jgi:hypothetical protein